MSERRMDALRRMAASDEAGLAAAAQYAIDQHNGKILARDDPEARPPGSDLTKRGHPFKAREQDGEVWVAIRERGLFPVNAQAYVDDRRRILVLLNGGRWAMVPTRVEVDHERQQVHVVAGRDSLTPW